MRDAALAGGAALARGAVLARDAALAMIAALARGAALAMIAALAGGAALRQRESLTAHTLPVTGSGARKEKHTFSRVITGALPAQAASLAHLMSLPQKSRKRTAGQSLSANISRR